jgi:hypothetical protein
MYDDITRVVDKYFSIIEESGGPDFISEFIPEDMKDNTLPSGFEGIQRWKVIPSTVTDKQIQEYEKQLGLRLPDSYKFFVKYKNFIEMSLGEYPVVFFKNLSTDWMETLLEQSQYYREHLEGRGLIPFADYSDVGVICFDSNASTGDDLEYPVVWLDHDDGFHQVIPLARNFTHLIRSCEPNLDDWIKSKRESRQRGA